ncbi:hypothetical protein [Cohnella hashimotonis]|uniref:Uncharacterized protein n=1 Tax=Cohnella hashimotonis TaxID=2826895 RepID=A0ABT6TKN2_9BACL|nr:hypothetical protein [Cohnella hashimotonis]MDI4647285.1 hypothetical protein [Cohnella hashimotonis]
MSSTFLFMLCLADVVAASVLLATGASPGVGVTMLVAGCIVSLVGVFTIVQSAAPARVERRAYSGKSVTR